MGSRARAASRATGGLEPDPRLRAGRPRSGTAHRCRGPDLRERPRVPAGGGGSRVRQPLARPLGALGHQLRPAIERVPEGLGKPDRPGPRHAREADRPPRPDRLRRGPREERRPLGPGAEVLRPLRPAAHADPARTRLRRGPSSPRTGPFPRPRASCPSRTGFPSPTPGTSPVSRPRPFPVASRATACPWGSRSWAAALPTATVLRAAAAFEQARPWIGRRPAL